ncbi:MAG: general secretion pathway protein GspB [Xanthomonadales bacterium]|nr:general secretion pathway protein GspB [Xanthomonadales bacterium]
MSLILEALRKSEAQRQQSEPGPTLPAAQPARRRAGMIWLVGGFAVAGGLLLGWLGSGWLDSGEADQETAVAARAPADHAEPAESERSDDAPPAPAVATVSSPGASSDTTQDAAGRSPDPEPLAAPGPPEPSVAPAMADTKPAQPVSPMPEDLPMLSQLPSVQAEIGKLAVNMLVYSEQSDARFTLINLKRYREGEVISPGLRVEAIRRDGVVLRFHDRLLLLPGNR